MKKENLPAKPLETLFGNVRQVIDEARNTVYRAANSAMVRAYWNIGKLIVEEEQNGKERAEYGEHLVKELSAKLRAEYGKGFDKTNVWNMRKFYNTFSKVDALRQELSWTHYRLLIRVEKESARAFYMQEAVAANWSTRQLERQINSLYHERLLLSTDKREMLQDTDGNKEKMTPEHLIKDPFVLEFLNVKQSTKLSESDLETALIDKLQDFLLELGKGFAFVARQHRVITETGKHFRIDLVFYNYILKCFLVIDLKSEELTHQDIGQMDMYVRLFDDLRKQEGDNPTIGLILCAEKDRTVAKYSLLNDSKQIFASKYQIYLPTEEELQKEIERERTQIELENRLGSSEQ